MSVLALVPFVVIPVARGVAARVAFVRLVTRVPQHVPFQVHTLVAAVPTNGAVKRFGSGVDPLVAPQVGQVPA